MDDDGARTIGATARESGLSVSALRFYDSVRVLRPARVDPATGYRFYTSDQVEQARLIAALRRVDMPVSTIGEVLAAGGTASAHRLLDQHLHRLESGLVDARRQLGLAHAILDRQETTVATTLTVSAADLAAALRAVGFAVSDDPALPALGGVLFDWDGTALSLVATDRYRLAVATVPVTDPDGPPVQVIAPPRLVDTAADLHGASVRIELSPRAVAIADRREPAVAAAFPNYRRLLPQPPTDPVLVDRADLRRRVVEGPTRTLTQAPGDRPHEVSAVLASGGSVDVVDDHPDAVGLNQEFLLQAIDAGRSDQLVLALDGTITPLAILDPDRAGDLTLLMPTRLS